MTAASRNQAARDESWIRDASAQIAEVDERIDTGRATKLFTDLLAQRLECSSAIYRAECGTRGMRVGFGASTGFAVDPVAILDRYLGQVESPRFGHYDPLRPEVNQRNVVFGDEDLVGASPVMNAVYGDIGVRKHSVMRVLVCDGPLLLGWLGCFREEPLGARERALLGRLVPALQDKLRLMHGLSEGAAVRALDVAMDAIAVPAFLVGPGLSVAYANSAGVRLLQDRRGDTMRRLDAAIGDAGAAAGEGVSVRRVSAHDSPPLHFAVFRAGNEAGSVELTEAARRWGLSPREAEVLRLLARGDANKDIASKLCCAVSTVEVHVGSILRKSRSENRAQVVARVWTGG